MTRDPRYDLLVPKPTPPRDSWRWGTVMSITPLDVQLDGDSTPLGIEVDSTSPGATFSVGRRVWCQLFTSKNQDGREARRVIIHGGADAGGGPAGATTIAVQDSQTVDLTLTGNPTSGYLLTADVIGGTGGGGTPGTGGCAAYDSGFIDLPITDAEFEEYLGTDTASPPRVRVLNGYVIVQGMLKTDVAGKVPNSGSNGVYFSDASVWPANVPKPFEADISGHFIQQTSNNDHVNLVINENGVGFDRYGPSTQAAGVWLRFLAIYPVPVGWTPPDGWCTASGGGGGGGGGPVLCDTGLVPMPLNPGFESATGDHDGLYLQRIGNVVYTHGVLARTNINPSNNDTNPVGVVPPGFRPVGPVIWTSGLVTGLDTTDEWKALAGMRVAEDGSFLVRGGATVAGYYPFGGQAWVTDDDFALTGVDCTPSSGGGGGGGVSDGPWTDLVYSAGWEAEPDFAPMQVRRLANGDWQFRGHTRPDDGNPIPSGSHTNVMTMPPGWPLWSRQVVANGLGTKGATAPTRMWIDPTGTVSVDVSGDGVNSLVANGITMTDPA